MIPRLTLDIGYVDLFRTLIACADVREPTFRDTDAVEKLWVPGRTLAHLSVRSTLDTYLAARQFPEGTEVLMSAVSIPHMGEILKSWGLSVVPIDLDLHKMSPTRAQLVEKSSERTKVVLIAQLFGGISDLSDIAELCAERGWDLLEDCAQAYDGSSYRGQRGATLSMFSFGTIKTATALGGALTTVRDTPLLAKMRDIRDAQPVSSRTKFFQKVLKMLVLRVVAMPWVFGMFVRLCMLFRVSYDVILNNAVKGFSGPDLFARLRQRPPKAMLGLLKRRIAHPQPEMYLERGKAVRALFDSLPSEVLPLGTHIPYHTGWVIPVLASRRESLVTYLRGRGYDATSSASSMQAIEPSVPHLPARRMEQTFRHVVYLPIFPRLGERGYRRLGNLISEFYSHPQMETATSPRGMFHDTRTTR